ncbi:alpha/beta hydrolase [Paracoccaceae bacterium]|nr:alpha/beta hydrolase [Paracoccaceae bacterium]
MKSLDDEYANAAYIPGANIFVSRWQIAAADFRITLSQVGRAELDVAYGDTDRQRFDLFAPLRVSKGVMIFVHGGYWLKFDKSYWSHLAQGGVEKGWHVALPSYDLCPNVRIHQITDQIAQAVKVIGASVAGPITLVGHSAGGHLVARMAVGELLPKVVHARIAKVMPISPVADLRPMRQTKMNEDLRLSEADAIAESPALMDRPSCSVNVWVGAEERPAFINQAKWLSAAWEIPLTLEPTKHHFDVIESLSDPSSDMITQLLGA